MPGFDTFILTWWSVFRWQYVCLCGRPCFSPAFTHFHLLLMYLATNYQTETNVAQYNNFLAALFLLSYKNFWNCVMGIEQSAFVLNIQIRFIVQGNKLWRKL